MGDPARVPRTRDGATLRSTLALPKYRIRLELGDIDGLFPSIRAQVSTDPGVRRRLQAVGFLYEPLAGKKIDQVAQDAWEHFKKIESQASDADAVSRLREMVRNLIVDQNRLPDPGQFGMIRVPGAYCDTHGQSRDRASPATSFHYQQEAVVWNQNPSLGMIPVVAHLEVSRLGEWKPAPAGLFVHFQLLPPDIPPAGHAVTPPPLRGAPTAATLSDGKPVRMTGSPQLYLAREKARVRSTAGDPQAPNADRSVGGKRGYPVGGNNRFGNVFCSGPWPGFHDRLGFHPAQASRHAHAAKVSTNLRGEAGVFLMPAWTGGDRYKIRAFLDPLNDSPSRGTESWAARAETGTLVVWRILRFSKYLRWEYPPGTTIDQKNHCDGDMEDIDVAGVLATEYRKAWMDVTVEADAETPQPIGQAEWVKAVQFAKERLTASRWLPLTQTYDLRTLVSETPHPGFIHLLMPEAYDRAPKGTSPSPGWPSAADDPLFWHNMDEVIDAMKEEMMEYFTRSALGGLTLIQAPAIVSYTADQPETLPGGGIPAVSGAATNRRGGYIFFGKSFYTTAGHSAPHDHTRTALHETGHLLFRPHQYVTESAMNLAGGVGGAADEHDYHDLCVMGYMPGAGEFCGRCLLNHAGWNVGGMPPNGPGP